MRRSGFTTFTLFQGNPPEPSILAPDAGVCPQYASPAAGRWYRKLVKALSGASAGLALVLTGLALPAAPAQAAESVVYSLGLHTNDGLTGSGVARAADGTVYGTSESGGQYNYGVLFKRGTDGSYTFLYSFINDGTDGLIPEGNPIIASDGNLYGTTRIGGTANCGAVWRYTLPAGIYSVLYFFTGAGTNAANANSCSPVTGVIEGSDGFLYGVTQNGGLNTSNTGTVFKLSKAGVYTNLHSFANAALGTVPTGTLIQGADGDLYGTTLQGGGSNSYGTIFKVSTTGAFTRLFVFPDSGVRGSQPYGGLAQLPDGSFVGTVYSGLSGGYGGLYRMTFNGAGNAVVTIVRSFGNVEFGQTDSAPTLAPDGAVYGVLDYGGGTSNGLIYRYSVASGFSNLHDLTSAEGNNYGCNSVNNPVLGGDGQLYMASCAGGDQARGTAYSFDTAGTVTRLLSLLDPASFEGRYPQAPLVQNADGSFYGTATSSTIQSFGTLFRLATDGSLKPVLQFDPNTVGSRPIGNLLRAADGSLFGASQYSGVNGTGTIFHFTPNADPSQPGTASAIYSFPPVNGNTPNGAYPSGGLSVGSDGAYYGMTQQGGATKSYGTLFRITPAGAYTRLYAFPNGGNNGLLPIGGLTAAGDGFLYGVTQQGGSANVGVLFKTGITANTYSNLYAFGNGAGLFANGYYPTAKPILGRDGALYGTASQGGNVGYGTVYRVTSGAANTLSRLFSFDDYTLQGGYPGAPLLLAGDGNFYGTTTQGGSVGYGTVFRLTPQGAFSKLYDFTRAPDGDTPQAALIQAVNGDLLTTTNVGGTFDEGAIVKLDGPADSPAGLSAGAASQSVNLSWNAAARATGYAVYASTSPNVQATIANLVVGATANTSYTVSGLTDGTPYYFVVTANGLYGETQVSNEVTATPFTDTLPDAYPFNDVSNAPISTLMLSNTITVNDINVSVPLVLSGGGNPQYSVNGGNFKYYNTTNGQPMVANGNTVRLRLASAATGNTATVATLALGSGTSSWTVTTAAMADKPNPFDFKDKTNQPKNRFIGSGGVRISGINVPVPISISGDPSASFRINKGGYIAGPAMVSNGDLVVLRLKSSTAGSTAVNAMVNIGGVTDSWTVTTVP